MEIYLEVKIATSNIKIIGKFIPMLVQNPYLDIERDGQMENKKITLLNQISPEIITRN